MTREHLVGDIENVLELAGQEGDSERLRRAFAGLLKHVRGEPGVPERVVHCLAESVRVLERGEAVDADTRDYACTCLEAALDFAREPDQEAPLPEPR